ncbi:hypothetical protein J1N35_000695 [Gossypium stocksii]|uniref:Aspartic peptidase DDI1-type domain-containing protein n=1 Tax=Gossypium stocksii TaxID=47602 RepID=A0A9D4AKC4_9ROSI|nr:hypothetical protein J1N35_000695 [Gossypium stocksii]
MVVSAIVVDLKVKKILVDSGSIVEVLSWEAYRKMGLKEHPLSKASKLYGFMNNPIEVKGSITLPITLGDGTHTTTAYVQFYVVEHLITYNAIFGRLMMRMERMVVTIFCVKIKFPMSINVGFLQSK